MLKPRTETNFVDFLVSLFKHHKFIVCREEFGVQKDNKTFRFDLVVRKNEKSFYIEAKSYNVRNLSRGMVSQISSSGLDHYSSNTLMITNSCVDSTIKKTSGIQILDLPNLLFLAKDNEKLYNTLLSFLDYSVNDILPQYPQALSGLLNIKNEIDVHLISKDFSYRKHLAEEKYIEKLESWEVKTKKENGQGNSKKYEKLCTEILQYLFIDVLSLWKPQQNSNAGLFRFDLICKVKDGQDNPFWVFLVDFFKSKYIVFEFKNYSNMITQKEIYTTEKYLYSKAFRSVAFVISCYGNDKNSGKAIKGILRESGKLIICLSNQDLINLIRAKLNREDPSDYLYAMLDKLLIELDK